MKPICKISRAIICTLTLSTFALTAMASTYDFSYSGRLVDKNGKPHDGPVSLRASFYHSASGGSSVLDVTTGLDNVALQDGVFQVTLALDPQDFHSVFPSIEQATYIQITDLTHNKAYSRQQISMLPYAGKIPIDDSKLSWNSYGELTLVDSSVNLGSPGAIGATTPSTAQFTTVVATAPTTASTVLTIRGLTGQSANLSEWKNSSGTTLAAVDAAGTLKFTGGTAFSIGLKAPATLAANFNYTLPVSPVAGAYLSTDANGVMSWVTSSSSVDATGLTGLTQGSVPFAASSGLAEDNANLFWDDTNNRLGIGTTTPAAALDVYGNIKLSNMRTYALTRTLPTTVNSTVDIGSLNIASKSAALTIKVATSGFGATKIYQIPLSHNQTGTSWHTVMPINAALEGSDDFALEAQVDNAAATFRLRRSAGTTAGTAYITILHDGVMTDAFTASTNVNAGVGATTGNFNATLLSMSSGGIVAGGPLTLFSAPTVNLHAATKQYVDDLISAGVTASSTTTLTGKTIDADNNTISNISNTNIKAGAAIDDTKLATISTAGKVSGAAITSGTIAGSTAISTSGDLATTGKVGIGGAAGTSKLEITGSGATSATSALNVMNSTPTSLLYVRNDGNVGIGTTSPGALTHIVLPSAGAADQTALILGNKSFAVNMMTDIVFQAGTGGGSERNTAAIKARQTSGTSGDLLFYTDAGSLIQQMIINSSGNVGIGLATPIEKLSAFGSISSQFSSASFPNIRGIFSHLGDSGGLSITAQGANHSVNGSGDIRFLTSTVNSASGSTDASTAEQMRILYNGNVGIGTTAPSDKLVVSGTSRIGAAPTTLTTVNGAHLSTDTTITVASTTSYPSAGTLLIANEAITYTGTTATTFTGCTRGVMGTTAAALTNGTTVNNYLGIMQATSTTPKMVVTGSGNVGIGTASPTSTLTVNGSIGIVSGGTISQPAGNVLQITAGTSSFLVGNGQGGPLVANSHRIDGALHAGYSTDFHISSGGTYANNQSAGHLHLRGGENWAGGTNSNAGDVYVYGGLGSGTGTSGNVILATNGTARGNVGIGSSSPTVKLDVQGDATSSHGPAQFSLKDTKSGGANIMMSASTVSGVKPYFGTITNHPTYFVTNNAYRWGVSSAGGISFGGTYYSTDAGANNAIFEGNVGIGTTSTTYKLTVNGEPGANGYTAFTNYSDRRLKRNIEPIADGTLSKILQLKPSSFNYNELSGYDEATRNRRINGFIAQDLKPVFPEMVHETKINGKKYFDTNLSSLQIYLVKAMQELKGFVDSMFADQSERILSLESKVETLEAKLDVMMDLYCQDKPTTPVCSTSK